MDPIRPTLPVPSLPAPTASTPSAADRFRERLRSLAQGERQLEASFRAGMRADATDSATLLRLQADVYRYSLEFDMAGRLLERATSAVKQVLQSQG